MLRFEGDAKKGWSLRMISKKKINRKRLYINKFFWLYQDLKEGIIARKCPYCGKKIGSLATKCWKCGGVLGDKPSTLTPPSPKKHFQMSLRITISSSGVWGANFSACWPSESKRTQNNPWSQFWGWEAASWQYSGQPHVAYQKSLSRNSAYRWVWCHFRTTTRRSR